MSRLSLDNIPSSLRSRDGWVNYFELKRTTEPHIHQIEPTNQCHYSCIMCPRSEKMTRKVGFMDMGLYHKIIDEVEGYSEPVRAKEIELFHFGESLLHPELDTMVEYASQKDLKITLSVNPPELTPEKTEKILKANPYKIIISLDGYDKESYKRIRGNHADYEKAVSNIDSAISIHKKYGSGCELLVRMIQFDLNKNYAASFVANWGNRGIQTEIRQYFPWNDERMKELGEFEKYPPFMP